MLNRFKITFLSIACAYLTSCDKAEIIFMQGPCYSITGGLALNDDQVSCCETVYCGWIEGQIKDNQCKSECDLDTYDTGSSDYSFTSGACNTCVDSYFATENAKYGNGSCVEWGELDSQSNFQALAKSSYTESESDTCPVDLTEDDGSEILGGQSTLAGIKAALGSANDLISSGTTSASTGTEELPTAVDFAHLEVSASTAKTSDPNAKKDNATGISSIELPGIMQTKNTNGSVSESSNSLTSMGLSNSLPAVLFGASSDEPSKIESTGESYKSGGNFTSGISGAAFGGTYSASASVGMNGDSSVITDLTRLPATSSQTLIIADPDDYFTRTDISESIFKIVERRYRSTSLKWQLELAKTKPQN